MTSLFRFLVILITIVFTAAACAPAETSSDDATDPTPNNQHNNQHNDVGFTDTDPYGIRPIPDNVNISTEHCGEIDAAGTCLQDTLLWCSSSDKLRVMSCPEVGGTGCNAGICTGIQLGYECDDRRQCADNLICRRYVCTVADPGVLTVRVVGNGRITSSTLDIDCTDECWANGPGFTEVSLHAEPAPGSRFIGWSNACSGNTENTRVTLTTKTSKTCVATFERTHATVQTVVRNEGGRVTSEPAGIDCPDNCSMLVELEQSVTLTAAPKPNFEFKRWSGCLDSSDPSITFTANAEHQCVAVFEKYIDLSIETAGPGRVSIPRADIDCPGTCDAVILSGERYQITAIPDAGARFVRWEGYCDQTPSSTMALHITSNDRRPIPDQIACKAIFEEIPYHPVSVTIIGDGTVTSHPAGIDCPEAACSAEFRELTNVSLRATSTATAQFVGWTSASPDDTSGKCISQLELLELSIREARHCQAEFITRPTLRKAWQYNTVPPNFTQLQ